MAHHGLGPEAIRLAARCLFEVRGHHRLTIDPAAENLRAIHAYERVGFRPVGVMRQYERGRDGTWHDGLLMDTCSSASCASRRRGLPAPKGGDALISRGCVTS